jgi:hypothetical protein
MSYRFQVKLKRGIRWLLPPTLTNLTKKRFLDAETDSATRETIPLSFIIIIIIT